MTSRKTSKLEIKLRKKISPIQPSMDEVGEFFHYCSYHHHPGIIGYKKAKICVKRGCFHYQKFRKE